MARRPRKRDRSIGVFATVLMVVLFAVGVLAAPRLDGLNIEHALNATVKIESGARMCAGVVVLGDGLILTNAHCAGSDDKTVDVELRDGRKFVGLVIVRDEKADVMVVAIRMRGLVHVPLVCAVKVAQGDEVTAVGHPAGLLWSVTRGIVVALDRGDNKEWMQIDAVIWFGNSGGPLFDRWGRLIGLNNAVRAEALPWGGGQVIYGLTLNLRHICAALKRNGVEVR